jgi:hypothetical protein
LIGSYGGIAPTQWEAVAEALRRIEQDTRLSSETRVRVGDVELDDREESLVRSALAAYREDAQQFAEDDDASEWDQVTWQETIERIDALLVRLG